MNFKEYLAESKLKDGTYYIIEMPSKENDFKPKKLGGPFKSYDEAEKSQEGPFGINQDKVIAVIKAGELFMPHHATKKATDNRLSNILGARHKNLEAIL